MDQPQDAGEGFGPPAITTPPQKGASWPFVGYAVNSWAGFTPEPAPKRRAWIDATPNAFARRCLPLMMANQAGWIFRAPFGFRARWDGSTAAGGIDVVLSDPAHPARTLVSDHFGAGILTFSIPYLFRTPAGTGLLVRGAPNFWVEGAHPLEGLVETDWATATFTMNWKITTPGRWVRFHAQDPVCFLQPFPIATVETAAPVIAPLDADPDTARAYRDWSASREEFNADPTRPPEAWQKDYFLGRSANSGSAPTHRTRVRTAPFHDTRPPALPAPETAATCPATDTPAGIVIASGQTHARKWVTDDFCDFADDLRAAVEDHFDDRDPSRFERGVWDLFHTDGQYAYLRTLAERVVNRALLERYREALSEWGWHNLGMGRVTNPLLSLYLSGGEQGLHNDADHSQFAFVHSLSPTTGFTGGATLLLRTEPYWGTTRTGEAGSGTAFVDKIAPTFNRLLVFDTRLIHGVQSVHGSWNPHHGRLVLQGQFRAGGLRLTGAVRRRDAAHALRCARARVAESVPELGQTVRATVGVRLQVGADGSVEAVSVLSAWAAPLTAAAIPPDLLDRLTAALALTHFADGPGTATFTVPIDDLRPDHPCPRKVGGLTHTETPEGFAVTDSGGVRHLLNHSAMFILESCTGDVELPEIAREVQEAFALPETPRALVEQALRELRGVGLVDD